MEKLFVEELAVLRECFNSILLGVYPTPIVKVNELNDVLGIENLYIKRDDLSSDIYGGNKVRKLEFIFGDIKKRKKKTVITFGLSGSNHVLATIIYSKYLGMNCVGMLLPQPNSRYVRKTLLADVYHDGEIHENGNRFFLAFNLFFIVIKKLFKEKQLPYIIPPGGSSGLGTIGFVAAAFELSEQIARGEIKKPDIVYIPMGSTGSAAGLILGFKILGLDIKVCAVRVSDKKYANKKKLIELIKKTNKIIHKINNSIPIVDVKEDDFIINDNQFGDGYGVFNKIVVETINLFYKKTNIILDGTYTSKTFAAIIEDKKNNKINNKVVLFWNTYNSQMVSVGNELDAIARLPKKFIKYFIKPVQDMDDKISCYI
jgi:D-cysteine desulfhydrase